MPPGLPPRRYAATPHRWLLAPGTVLWRIHPQRIAATEFTPYRANRATPVGRFDGSYRDPYSTCDAATRAESIVVDVLLRGIPKPGTGFRRVRRVSVAGQRASAVATATRLELVSLLDGPALSAVAQDTWLVHSEDCRDPLLREWAVWLRERAPWAQGFVWPVPGETGAHLVVLFGDRCDSGVFEPTPRFEVDLDGEVGAVWLNGVLVPYLAHIAPPRG